MPMKQQKEKLTKVFFDLDPDDWHGYSTESLWAEKVGSDRFRLRNTPFFARGVSAEDIVIAKPKDGNLFFETKSISAGHSTYRIIVNEQVSDSELEAYWTPLAKLGCTYESAELKLRLLAVDVPQSANIYEVYALLEKGQKSDIWSFEEGDCGHKLNG